jgi:demethylmenaquinone methyltransferase/2-methoxy-6-polyprenyl-1,4-benzoquinol methylase
MRFPDGNAFVEILTEAGFGSVSQDPLTFGIATLYIGTKGEHHV